MVNRRKSKRDQSGRFKRKIGLLDLPVELHAEILSYLCGCLPIIPVSNHTLNHFYIHHILKPIRCLGATCKYFRDLTQQYEYSNLEIRFRRFEKILKSYASLIEPSSDLDYRRLRYIKSVAFVPYGIRKGRKAVRESEPYCRIDQLYKPMDEITSVVEALAKQDPSWESSKTAKASLMTETILALLRNLKTGQLKEFIWDIDHERDQYYTPKDANLPTPVLKHILEHQPNIISLHLAVNGKILEGVSDLLPSFKGLHYLRLWAGGRSERLPLLVFNMLKSNEDTLLHLDVSGCSHISDDLFLVDAYQTWLMQNPGQTIRLKRLWSMVSFLHRDFLVGFSKLRLIERDQLRRIYISVQQYTISRILFPGSELGISEQAPHFPRLALLRISAYHLESNKLLESFIRSLVFLEELEIQGITTKLDLENTFSSDHEQRLKRFRLSLGDFRYSVHDQYSVEEIGQWASRFKRLKVFLFWSDPLDTVIFNSKHGVILSTNRTGYYESPDRP
ncbi:hypothetical protein ABW19_dt0202171 [Dactylella cylindrospora]|nr:hypothetical protein ABW19_dt0202171 [Dactylella cylindrospora]